MPLPRPVIVVPGNPGSALIDLYPVRPDDIWAQGEALGFIPRQIKKLDRVPVHPDEFLYSLNTSGGPARPSRLVPLNPLARPYEDLVETLRGELYEAYKPAPVFPFGYDWRMPAATAAQSLGSFIDVVLGTTGLLPDARPNPPSEVDIVAHSFGGVVTARYLHLCQKSGRPSRVRKVVSLGSPLSGAAEAVWKLTGDLKERHVARTLPSVYELLPWFDDAVLDNRGKAVDLAVAGNWPTSVQSGLAEYCTTIGAKAKGPELFKRLLKVAVENRNALRSLDLNNPNTLPGGPAGWLPMAGMGEATHVRIRVDRDPAGNPWFEAEEGRGAGAKETGDGTVPLLGAVPPFLDKERLVCFKDDETELKERATMLGLGELLGAASFHAFLPMMNAAQRVAVAFLRDGSTKGDLKARKFPGVKKPTWPSWLEAV